MGFKSAQEVLNWFDPDQEDLWLVKFIDIPIGSVFSGGVPAADVDDGIWTINHKEQEAGGTGWTYPLGTTPHTVSMTLYDDARQTLTTWFTNWVESIVKPMPGAVLPLTLSHRKCMIEKIDRSGNMIKQRKLLVIPDGSYHFKGNSASSELQQFTIDFKIVGTY